MKKLIVISMVLAMATIASAGVAWNATYDAGTQTITADLVGEDILQFVLSNGGSGIKGDGTGTFGDVSINSGFTFASGTGKGFVNGQDVYIVQGLVDTTAGDPAVTGTLWSFTYTLTDTSGTEVVFDVADGAFAKTADATLPIGDLVVPIPEPMTLGLLGLGGLFLRRRK